MNFQKTQAIFKKTQGKWTKNSVLRRINPHSSSTKLLKKSLLYKHFSTQGHSHADMLIHGIELVHGDDFVLAARERFWIDKLQTTYKGLNSYRT